VSERRSCEVVNLLFSLSFSWSQSYQNFFSVKQRFIPFFANKLGRFKVQNNIFLGYKHSTLTSKNRKIGKTKFGRIDSWFYFLVTSSFHFMDTFCTFRQFYNATPLRFLVGMHFLF
jgi:hypothetical protein